MPSHQEQDNIAPRSLHDQSRHALPQEVGTVLAHSAVTPRLADLVLRTHAACDAHGVSTHSANPQPNMAHDSNRADFHHDFGPMLTKLGHHRLEFGRNRPHLVEHSRERLSRDQCGREPSSSIPSPPPPPSWGELLASSLEIRELSRTCPTHRQPWRTKFLPASMGATKNGLRPRYMVTFAHRASSTRNRHPTKAAPTRAQAMAGLPLSSAVNASSSLVLTSCPAKNSTKRSSYFATAGVQYAPCLGSKAVATSAGPPHALDRGGAERERPQVRREGRSELRAEMGAQGCVCRGGVGRRRPAGCLCCSRPAWL